MGPRETLCLFVACVFMWMCIGCGVSYCLGRGRRPKEHRPNTTNIMLIVSLILGLLVSILLYNGLTTYALGIYIVGVTASVVNLLNLNVHIMPGKATQWKPRWLGKCVPFYINPYVEQFFYMPILFFLMIPRLQSVSPILQAITYRSDKDTNPYVSLADPVLVTLFVMLSSWSNVVTQRRAMQNTFRSLFKSSCLYMCIFIQLLLNDNCDIFYHSTNVFRILNIGRPQNISQLEYFSNILLLLAIALVGMDQFLSRVPKNWYANCVSILNLICGLVGISFLIIPPKGIVSSNSLSILILSCVMLGQLFDLFDGRIAERWGSTKNGELFDDVADATSFGVVIGILIYNISTLMLSSLTQNKLYSMVSSLFLSGVYIICVLYRLVRFVINKRAQNVKGGVYFFFGLPSPATAAISGLTCVLFEQGIGASWRLLSFVFVDDNVILIKYITFSTIILSLCVLTVLHIPYPHLGRVLYRRGVLPQSMRVCMEASFVIFTLYGIYYRTPILLLWWMGVLGLLYILTPFYANKLNWYSKDDIVREKHDETLILVQRRKVEQLERAHAKALAKLNLCEERVASRKEECSSPSRSDSSPK